MGKNEILKMESSCSDEKKVDVNSTENEVEEEEEEEEETTLSLCDFPINEESQSVKHEAEANEPQEDFNFGSWGGSVLTETEMCAADEVFFQGQILPLRHSVSSESGFAGIGNDSRNFSRCVSRAESVGRCYSGGSSSYSSRSSSINSRNSSNSCSALTSKPYKPRRNRNQFHSHPSPTPQIRFSSARHGNFNNFSHHSQQSMIWSFLRLGLVQKPEIASLDLKLRSNNQNNNQRYSTKNRIINSKNNRINDGDNNKMKNILNIEKKPKQGFFDRNGALCGGCKCSINAVETVPSRISTIKSGVTMTEAQAKEEKEEAMTKTTKVCRGKQSMSRHRTSEWLKQLSLESGPDGGKIQGQFTHV
ncbi:unnamed protein product [Ilex paraguariensis]|uniref:Uncharacterized protein n=1 Tax=Ilex paraguariensis TaxID=185542 RepID=A0ABC8RGD0_9AQUA